MINTAIILAGGLGTRLQPLTDDTPKPLLPLKGKPMIAHIINNFKKYGVNNIILSIGYKSKQIKEHFGDGSKYGVNIIYSIEEEPLGTGGAIMLAAKDLTKPFFLAWGDNLADFDLHAMYKAYLRDAPQVTMALTPREDVENFGVAKLEENKIINFVEKPQREEAPSNLINAGAFIIDPQCLKILPQGNSSMERDCFEKLAPLGEISVYKHEGQWFPTDTLEKYSDACLNFIPKIDFTKKKIIIADVDETICESCQEVSTQIAERINSLIKKSYHFAFISGTPTNELQRMISSKLTEEHHLLGNTGTHYQLINSKESTIYQETLADEEKKEITEAFNKLIEEFNIQSLTTKEDQLQDRGSQITLSAIGRNAPSELKAKYDPNGEKRKVWVNFLKNILGEKYEIKFGGTTSIDITKKGLDKEWGIRRFAQHHGFDLNEIIFFGDKIYPGGNDYPASKIVDCVSVKNPEDCLRKLNQLL